MKTKYDAWETDGETRALLELSSHTLLSLLVRAAEIEVPDDVTLPTEHMRATGRHKLHSCLVAASNLRTLQAEIRNTIGITDDVKQANSGVKTK